MPLDIDTIRLAALELKKMGYPTTRMHIGEDRYNRLLDQLQASRFTYTLHSNPANDPRIAGVLVVVDKVDRERLEFE